MTFSERLYESIKCTNSVVVMGIDPTLKALPPSLSQNVEANDCESLAEAYDEFAEGLLKAAEGRVPAVKPNIAFFEAIGLHGLAVYRRICRVAHEAGFLVIGDVKRGDIGSTAAAYAEGLLPQSGEERLARHDALTLNPYLGSDSVEPFFEQGKKTGAGFFVLAKTSNPSSADLQDLPLASGGTVAEAVAKKIAEWGEKWSPVDKYGWSSIGAVVGATHGNELAKFRSIMPNSWLLLPGYGAQGAKASDLSHAFDKDGMGAIVNASRSIMMAWKERHTPTDWEGAAAQAIDTMNAELNAVRGTN